MKENVKANIGKNKCATIAKLMELMTWQRIESIVTIILEWKKNLSVFQNKSISDAEKNLRLSV